MNLFQTLTFTILFLFTIENHLKKVFATNVDYYVDDEQMYQNKNFRLPKTFWPKLYEVTLATNFDSKTYEAEVIIFVDCIQPTDIIILHGVDFQINSLLVKQIRSENSLSEKILVDAKKDEQFKWEEDKIVQQIRIPLKEIINVGSKISIKIQFMKSFLFGNIGFSYKEYNDSGKTWKIATAKFEPDCARFAFPCFDEPAMRAVFKFKIIRNKNLISLFNTRKIATTQVNENLEQDEFAETKMMSTYLLMFAICSTNFVFKESNYRGIKLRAYAPEGDIDKVSYALDISRKALEYFEKRTGIPYPGDSYDIISLRDRGNMARETWGFVSFTFLYMLYSKDCEDSQRVLTNFVATHEAGHHWFGNYVTIKWWNDYWLKEGTTTYFHKECLEKEIKDYENFVDVQMALNIDIHFTTFPLSLPDDFNNADSLITKFIYKKGCSLLNMVESFIGREKFDKGVKIFLNRYAYSSADNYDWWNAMTEAFDKDDANKINLLEIMEPWMKQNNFPLVHISLNSNGQSFTARQEQFLLNKREIHSWQNKWPPKFNYLWNIPLKFRTSQNANENIVWLKEKEQTFHLNQPVEWIKLNYAHVGYYVTKYDQNTWRLVLNNAIRHNFDAMDIAGILLDLQFLLRSGTSDMVYALDFLSILPSNLVPLIWKIGSEIIKDVYSQIPSEAKEIDKFKRHMREIVSETMAKTGNFWTKENLNYLEKILHMAIFTTGMLVDEDVTSAHLLSEFQKMLQNSNYVPNKKIASFVLPYGIAKRGNNDAWEIIWQRYKKTSDDTLLTALCSSNSNTHLEKLLKEFENDAAKTVSMLTKIAENGHFKDKIWNILNVISPNLNKNLHIIDNKKASSPIFLLLEAIVKHFKTDEDLKKVKSFFQENVLGHSLNKRFKIDILEIILSNIQWHEAHFGTLQYYYGRKYQ